MSTPRLLLALAALVLLDGCSFRDFARRSNTYPDAYDRALAHATQSSPELAADIERLGARSSYNCGTHDLLWCWDAYADALRWKRQYEKGDLLTEEGLKQGVYARYGKVHDVELSRYAPDLLDLERPERGWLRGIEGCVDRCAVLAAGKCAFNPDPPMAEDVALAARTAAACKADAVFARAAVREREAGDRVARAGRDLDTAEASASGRHFLDLARALDRAEHDAREAGEAPGSKPLLERAARLRERRAAGLAKVAAYRADPRLALLQTRWQELDTQRRLLEQEIAEAERLMSATAGREGGEWGYVSGDPERNEAYTQRRALLLRRLSEIEAARSRVNAEDAALQDEYGIR